MKTRDHHQGEKVEKVRDAPLGKEAKINDLRELDLMETIDHHPGEKAEKVKGDPLGEKVEIGKGDRLQLKTKDIHPRGMREKAKSNFQIQTVTKTMEWQLIYQAKSPMVTRRYK